jgi:hypothetical protein
MCSSVAYAEEEPFQSGINAPLIPPALNRVQSASLMIERSFSKKMGGETADFAGGPAGMGEPSAWERSNCLANVDRILPLGLWSCCYSDSERRP